jgi:hypothetical protein
MPIVRRDDMRRGEMAEMAEMAEMVHVVQSMTVELEPPIAI